MRYNKALFKNKINFTSLGCPRNLVDSEVMLGILLKAGYEVVEALDEADYLIVNTCGFLALSRQESVEAIREVQAHKKEEAKIIITGCMVATHREQIDALFPDIHFILGAGDVEGILEAIRSDQKGALVSTSKSYIEVGEVPRVVSTGSFSAYLKIAEGCRKACAYCIIPKIKGPLKSKSIERVVKEFQLLLQQGYQEIILIAQDLGDFGKDKEGRSSQLYELLREILKLKEDFWLRLLYLYPDEITDELIEIMQSDKRICPYLDMPIQHVNNEVLKRMRRNTNKEHIIETITKLKERIPGIHIRTSLIVGFPGETDRQFEELVQFIQEYPLHHVGIFAYSNEEGSAAYTLEGQLSEEVKEKRLEILASVQREAAEKENHRLIGQLLEVVIEGYHPESELLMVGRHKGQAPEIDSQVIINDPSFVDGFNKLYTVEITAVSGLDLVGVVVRPTKTKSAKKKTHKKLALL
jgi:ribosomal protein S12 methylthiotransferase